MSALQSFLLGGPDVAIGDHRGDARSRSRPACWASRAPRPGAVAPSAASKRAITVPAAIDSTTAPVCASVS